MVMSGASCSSLSSNGGGVGLEGGGGGSGVGVGGGDGGGGGRKGLSVATSGRAEGGKVGNLSSSVSGLMQGWREKGAEGMGEAPATEKLEAAGTAGASRKFGVKAVSSNDDWMAINLEKLSSFRVPETRMGFPDGAREVGGGL